MSKNVSDQIVEMLVNVGVKRIYAVTGCIGKPSIARSNRANQLFFVNGRFVKDKTLTSAAEQAYKGMLTIGKYGFLILNIEIDPHKIDVNVHPAKLEIRFQEENLVFKLVYHAIKDALLNEDYLGRNKEDLINQNTEKEEKEDILDLINQGMNTKFDKKELEAQREFIYSTPVDDINRHKDNENKNISNTGNAIEDIYNDKFLNKIDEIFGDINQSKDKIESSIKENDIQNNTDVETSNNEKEIEKKSSDIVAEERAEFLKECDLQEPDKQNEPEILDNDFAEMYKKTFGKLPGENKVEVKKDKDPEDEKNKIEIETAENVSLFENKSFYNKVKYKYIGIAFSTYIIVEIDSELYIIDQHAAHERILYEKIKKNYYSDSDKDSQMMLLPDIINLTHKEMDIARDNMELFKKAGFELEEFGENTIKLMGVPNVCIDLDTKELFLESLDEINTVARTAKQEIEEKFIATVACKAAVKAKMALTFEEVDSLMQKLLVLDNPFTCPHGRPTAIKLSQSEIEKKFSRK